jgi:superfamily II DNA or RNA helicase
MSTSAVQILPPLFAIQGKLGSGNFIVQLRQPAMSGVPLMEPSATDAGSVRVVTTSGFIAHLTADLVKQQPPGVDGVLCLAGQIPHVRSELTSEAMKQAKWIYPVVQTPTSFSAKQLTSLCGDVRRSWIDSVRFKEETTNDEGVLSPGLREPQIGALHAILGHWRSSSEAATVVMPTGTGKTETMLATMISERTSRLLVVVPTVALREQISEKFITLGWLKHFGIVGPEAEYPIVGIAKKRFTSTEAVDDFFIRCNVIVTTMNVVGMCGADVQSRIASLCSHLFIDEAHHISAKTWNGFKAHFLDKPVLQFTATPFRTDGKLVGGKVIFNYPLSRAQQRGYFKPIQFRSVCEFEPSAADRAIAESATAALANDIQSGYDHILMARAMSIQRAEELYNLYVELAADLRPVLIHSELTSGDRTEKFAALHRREARIVVCVDMLGEGFDLPELKVAALHDMHKSLAITLQFVGRFTRTTDRIGNATVVANIADPAVGQGLQNLYAENADWNAVLRMLSQGATENQIRRTEFIAGFDPEKLSLPIQNIFPKMSAVVYKTPIKDWRPHLVADGIGPSRIHTGPSVNSETKTLVLVTKDNEAVPWGDIRELSNVNWNLYIIHWSEVQGLLFINSSDNTSLHEDVAKAVGGADVELIRGESIFRCLHNVKRFVIMNLGLSHVISKAIRFSMHVGQDIGQALSDALRENKTKSNLFGKGYEAGDEVTYGCSQKGRVWSYKIAYDLAAWVTWCHTVGDKLTDDTISTADIFKNVILPETISARPVVPPIAIEWDSVLLQKPERNIRMQIGTVSAQFFDVALELVDTKAVGPIVFRVRVENAEALYELRFHDAKISFVPRSVATGLIVVGRREFDMAAWFEANPPTIFFADGSMLVSNELFQLPATCRRAPFDPSRIFYWDWSGVDIKKESQGSEKRIDSIQYRVLSELRNQRPEDQFDILFDDDDAREVADVIAIKVQADCILVHLYHCKFSNDSMPGARIDDLYVVCGQAQRSVYWRGNVPGLFTHMQARDASRSKSKNSSRFEKGDARTLLEIARKAAVSDVRFKVFIVQPGLSKAKISLGQQELLAVTDLYLRETFDIEMAVIASA